MLQRRARLAVLVTLILFAPSVARAQQGHSIRGKVRDSAGNGVPRVIVDIQTGNGATVGQTNANNEGDFFFGGLTDSSYIVVVKSPDYSPVSETVDFTQRINETTPGETRTIEITLTPRAGISPRTAPSRVTLAQTVPAPARAAFERGMKLARDGKSDEAAAAVREAVQLFPEYFDARFWLANELIRTNHLDGALLNLEVARSVSPKDDRVYLSFGQLLMQKKNYGVAAAVFAEAARLNPSDQQGFMGRGVALVEYASVINPSASRASAEERRVALDDAEKALNEAYRISGKRLSAVRVQLARVYEKRGDRARAADELENYLRENPSAANAAAIREGIKTLRAPKP